MMKVFFAVLLGAVFNYTGLLGGWLMSGGMVFLYLLYTQFGGTMVDYTYVSSHIGGDSVSLGLITLSVWISLLMLISSSPLFSSFGGKMFVMLVYSLLVVLILAFSTINLFSFYFFFEASLIPTILIIMGWGYQPERLQAGVYFLFYTLSASLPLLMVLFYFYWANGGLDFYFMNTFMVYSGGGFIFFFLVMAFMVKMPMFFVHLWLPKAHVEAPVSGSMILAGVLLKLGGYGMYRTFLLGAAGLQAMGSYFFGLSVLGMVCVGLICCRLMDLKALVAYSSVAHMGMVICGIVSYYLWGYTGALIMMLSHGACSSGLFCAVNIYYERSGSRGFLINSGMISLLSIFTLMFFMLCVANMAAPPTLNLLSEIFLMGSMLKFNILMVLFFPLGSYLGAVFTLYLFSFSQHGKNYAGRSSFMMINFREYNLMFVHLYPINFLILKYDYFCVMF